MQVSSALESLKPRGARPDAATASGGSNVTVTSSCLPEFSKVGAWPSCYRFSTFNASWHEAREYCSAFGANLLALDSLKEAHIIDYLLNSKPGLSRQQKHRKNSYIWRSLPVTIVNASTVEHILTKCTVYKQVRENYYQYSQLSHILINALNNISLTY